MYALAIIRYRRPIEEVWFTTRRIRAYLQGLKAKRAWLAPRPARTPIRPVPAARVPRCGEPRSMPSGTVPYWKPASASTSSLPWKRAQPAATTSTAPEKGLAPSLPGRSLAGNGTGSG